MHLFIEISFIISLCKLEELENAIKEAEENDSLFYDKLIIFIEWQDREGKQLPLELSEIGYDNFLVLHF